MGKISEYLLKIRMEVDNLSSEYVSDIDIFTKFISDSKRVFVIGNGGSASIASHFVADLNKCLGVDAYDLTSIPLLTAEANDNGYENIFIDQLIYKHFNSNDLLVCITTSGESKNIIKAVRFAKEKRTDCIAIGAYIDSTVEKECHLVFSPKFYNEPRVAEDLASVVCHAVIERMVL
jgi:phosphoheptose isomerase